MSKAFYHLLVIGCYNFIIFAQSISQLRFSNEDEKAFIRESLSAGNYSTLAAFLRRQNFWVLEFEDNAPIVLVGDIAFSFENLIEQSLEGRTTNFLKSGHIWKDGNSAPHMHYFLDTVSKPDPDQIHAAVKSWTDNTCIQITEMPSAKCSKKSPHAAVCVTATRGCWSIIGRFSGPNKPAQRMSASKVCGVVSTAHEFGHALGFRHMQSRSDRDHFISVHPEHTHIGINSSKKEREKEFKYNWSQADCSKLSEEYELPTPYDYSSIMHYAYNAFNDEDRKGVYFARDARHQHLLMYTFDANYMQSHYDLFIVNTVYGCIKDWTKLCEANGKKAPVCQNLGYIGKNCTCICPQAFTGPICQRKIHDLFPPFPKAHVLTEVTEPQIVRFNESQFTRQPLETVSKWFQRNAQFITVIIRGKSDTYANALIEQNYNLTNGLFDAGAWFMDSIKDAEAGLNSLTVLWGTSRKGLMRAEYTSTFLNNEKDGLQLRARFSELELVSRNMLSSWFKKNNSYSIAYFLSLEMKVSFEPRADQHLKVKQCSYCISARSISDLLSFDDWVGYGTLAICMLVAALILVVSCCVRKKYEDDANSDSEGYDDEESSETESSSSSDSSNTKWYNFLTQIGRD